jgi:predicted site-specific integrase-resolvase
MSDFDWRCRVSYPTVSEKPLMTPAEVAKFCDVDPETVRRWGRTGKLTQRKTPSGRGTRFLRSEVYALMGMTGEGADQ